MDIPQIPSNVPNIRTSENFDDFFTYQGRKVLFVFAGHTTTEDLYSIKELEDILSKFSSVSKPVKVILELGSLSPEHWATIYSNQRSGDPKATVGELMLARTKFAVVRNSPDIDSLPELIKDFLLQNEDILDLFLRLSRTSLNQYQVFSIAMLSALQLKGLPILVEFEGITAEVASYRPKKASSNEDATEYINRQFAGSYIEAVSDFKEYIDQVANFSRERESFIIDGITNSDRNAPGTTIVLFGAGHINLFNRVQDSDLYSAYVFPLEKKADVFYFDPFNSLLHQLMYTDVAKADNAVYGRYMIAHAYMITYLPEEMDSQTKAMLSMKFLSKLTNEPELYFEEIRQIGLNKFFSQLDE